MPSNRLFNLININKLHKKKQFKTKLLNKDVIFLKFLIKTNLIKFIEKTNNSEYLVFINQSSKLWIKNLSKKKKQIMKLINLKKLIWKNKWLVLVSTNKGVISTKDCLKKKCGGFLTFKLVSNIF